MKNGCFNMKPVNGNYQFFLYNNHTHKLNPNPKSHASISLPPI
jgi:hypothetical protein